MQPSQPTSKSSPVERADSKRSDVGPSGIDPVLQRNITALVDRKKQQDAERKPEEKIADAISRFTGSMKFVYLHLALFGSWIVINVKYTPFPKFDPSFVILAMVASVEAIFLSTFVLITQNRLAAQADKRADLDLQISLLAEHEITRLVTLVAAIGKRFEIAEAADPGLEPLKQDVVPEHVLERLESKS